MSKRSVSQLFDSDSVALVQPIQDQDIDIGEIEIPEPFSDEETPAEKKIRLLYCLITILIVKYLATIMVSILCRIPNFIRMRYLFQVLLNSLLKKVVVMRNMQALHHL